MAQPGGGNGTGADATSCRRTADVPPMDPGGRRDRGHPRRRFGFPRMQETAPQDGLDYSYYYVPHLAELNQLVGYLFRTGLVRKDTPDAAATIKRYAAYSCEGTMYLGAGP